MKIILDNFSWGMVGEPYQIPCLRLTVNSLPANIVVEKYEFLRKGYLHVMFDEFQMDNPLPDIYLPANKKHNPVTLRSFIKSKVVADLIEEMMEAEENGAFEPGRKLNQKPIILET